MAKPIKEGSSHGISISCGRCGEYIVGFRMKEEEISVRYYCKKCGITYEINAKIKVVGDD